MIIRKITYLPARTYQASSPPPAGDDLGEGQIAINIPGRRVWIGTDQGVLEVTTLDELIDAWIGAIERHTQ